MGAICMSHAHNFNQKSLCVCVCVHESKAISTLFEVRNVENKMCFLCV